ncbi:hypothetical protein HHK36_029785 [Tetracentron sinense]|uniref:Uncharacterized protein n=1 Tax=Tetracentron sinense TaxID=13715 RepID=A0A835D019_TETSI|nr:hypothetical protein HHK36_029785 [Tetracentron sinense]
MGRSPSCDKFGVKKGPWTPEEDIILVSYVQEHGPGNWRAVPTTTGLDGHNRDGFSSSSESISKGQWERRLQTDIHKAKQALIDALSLEKPNYSSDLKVSNGCNSYTRPNQASSTYASSTENIARLLAGWARNSPKPGPTVSEITQHSLNNTAGTDSPCSQGTPSQIVSSNSTFESLFGFESFISDVSESVSLDETLNFESQTSFCQEERKLYVETHVPLSLLEKWLFDEGAAQEQEDLIKMSFDDSAELF